MPESGRICLEVSLVLVMNFAKFGVKPWLGSVGVVTGSFLGALGSSSSIFKLKSSVPKSSRRTLLNLTGSKLFLRFNNLEDGSWTGLNSMGFRSMILGLCSSTGSHCEKSWARVIRKYFN